MRTFPLPNKIGPPCPICKEHSDKPVVLIPISGTEDGNIMEARQYHLECLDLQEIQILGDTWLVQKI